MPIYFDPGISVSTSRTNSPREKERRLREESANFHNVFWLIVFQRDEIVLSNWSIRIGRNPRRDIKSSISWKSEPVNSGRNVSSYSMVNPTAFGSIDDGVKLSHLYRECDVFCWNWKSLRNSYRRVRREKDDRRCDETRHKSLKMIDFFSA